MSEPTLVPAGDIFGDIKLIALEDAVIPLGAIVLLKGLDEDGDVAWFTLYSNGLAQTEVVGALTVAQQVALAESVSSYLPECSADDDDEDF